MKCIIPGINLKVFGRAVHSLAKIGDELYLQPLEQGLSLRTVNSSRSAYACFLFFPSYFQHYDDGRNETETSSSSEEDDEGLRCKITMKSVMAVFRSLSTIEKTVEKCKITHNAKEARLIFELHCWHGIVKKHNLAYMESERLQAIFSKDNSPNKLTAPSKLLCEVVVNFQTTQEEVTLSVQPDVLSLKNYVEDEPDPNKVVHTELSLAPEEFDLYQVTEDTNITFCLKELRAILAFGETTGLPLNINFEAAGRPVTFSIDSDQTFEANFVLATLAEADQQTLSSSQVPPPCSQRPRQSASQPGRQKAAASQRGQRKPASSVSSAARRGTWGKSGAEKNARPNGDVSVPGRNVEQENTRKNARPNGDVSVPGRNVEQENTRQTARGEKEGEDKAGDITAEELAAAMEVEQEWESQSQRDRPPQAGDVQPPAPAQGRETHPASHTHATKRDTLAGHSPEEEEEKTLHGSPHRRDRQTDGEGDSHTVGRRDRRTDGEGDSHTVGRRDKQHNREVGKERIPREAEREAKSLASRASQAERGGGEGEERLGAGSRRHWSDDEEDEREGVSASPVIPVQCPPADVTREGACLQPLSEGEEDLDDTVPGTPPSTPPAKKFRSLFFGSSQKTSRPAHTTTTVLAADTDDEDD